MTYRVYPLYFDVNAIVMSMVSSVGPEEPNSCFRCNSLKDSLINDEIQFFLAPFFTFLLSTYFQFVSHGIYSQCVIMVNLKKLVTDSSKYFF